MAENTPFFSVVIPLYNKQACLRRSLESVLLQTVTDIEVIIVDDGSTDNSYSIASAYSDSRIRIIRQANAGVSAARNRGIEESIGKWVAFLDADDEWLPQFLQKVKDCTVLFPNVGTIYTRLNWVGQTAIPTETDNLPPFVVHDYFAFTASPEGQTMHGSSTTVRRDVFSKAGYFPVGVKIGEDTDTWHRLAWTTEIALVPEYLANYYLDSGDSGWQNATDWDIRISTYHSWRNSGRIPCHLQESTAKAHQRYVLNECVRHALTGKRRLALDNLISEVEFKYVPISPLTKTIICIIRIYIRDLFIFSKQLLAIRAL